MLLKILKNKLIKDGYDGIIIENTRYDSNTMGDKNTQYITFYPNQIKLTSNLKPTTTNDDIRYSIEGTKATDKNGNPILLYHGSPTKDIMEFDVEKAGNNALSGERAIFFTDSKDFADEFAYERKQGSSVHTFRRGEKGQIYGAYLDIKKPLDVRNLSMKDAEIIAKNAYIPITAEKLIELSKIPNKMVLKSYIDFTRLPSYGYDGYIGYAQQGVNKYEGVTEYAVFSNNQIIRKQDSDVRFSILAADDKTVYDEKEIRKAMEYRRWQKR